MVCTAYPTAESVSKEHKDVNGFFTAWQGLFPLHNLTRIKVFNIISGKLHSFVIPAGCRSSWIQQILLVK